MFSKFWNDESGIVAIEYLFLATIVGLGLVVGFSNLASAINVEYSELANAILALNQGYSVHTTSGCCAQAFGTNVTDTAGSVTLTFSTPAPATNINLTACP